MTKYFLLFCCRHLAWPLHWLTLAQVSEVSVVVSGPGPGSGGQPSLSGMLLETYCSDAATLSTVNTQNTTQLDRTQHPEPRQSTTNTEERKEHQHCFIE